MTKDIYYSEDSERAILGTILYNQEAINKVVLRLREDDFYLPLHQTIYKAILSLHKKGEGIDIITVKAEIERINDKDFIIKNQPGSYMGMLEQVLIGNIDYHIKIIRDKVLTRKLDGLFRIGQDKLKGEELDSIIEYTDNTLFDIKKKRLDREFKPLNLFLKEKLERDDKRKPGTPLGYKLDKFFSIQDNIEGIQPGVYLLGAYTNMGKTAFLTNIFLDLIQSNPGLRGVYLSLDDPRGTIIDRLLSILSGLPINEVKRTPNNEDNKIARLEAYEKLNEYSKERMEVVDISIENPILYIETEIRKNLGNVFICIDDLHNIELTGSYDTARDRNIAIANTIKRYTRIYDIPILSTVEMRKPIGSLMDKPPSIHDTMETGKYGYNADIYWVIHPKDINEFNEGRDTTLTLYYEKSKLSGYKKPQPLEWIRGTGTLKEINFERR